MNADRKKELRNAYKSKPVVGGVCCIRCSDSGHMWLQATKDTESLRNRFNFAVSTKSSPDPTVRAEWEKYGPEAFSFEVLEELKKDEDQTDKEFSDDIDALYELWLEKTHSEGMG